MELDAWQIVRRHPDGEMFDVIVTKPYKINLGDNKKTMCSFCLDSSHPNMPRYVSYVGVAREKKGMLYMMDVRLRVDGGGWCRREWMKRASVIDVGVTSDIEGPRDDNGLLDLKAPAFKGKVLVDVRCTSENVGGVFWMLVTGVETVRGVEVDDKLLVERNSIVDEEIVDAKVEIDSIV